MSLVNSFSPIQRSVWFGPGFSSRVAFLGRDSVRNIISSQAFRLCYIHYYGQARVFGFERR
jgi:hypothetical protein